MSIDLKISDSLTLLFSVVKYFKNKIEENNRKKSLYNLSLEEFAILYLCYEEKTDAYTLDFYPPALSTLSERGFLKITHRTHTKCSFLIDSWVLKNISQLRNKFNSN